MLRVYYFLLVLFIIPCSYGRVYQCMDVTGQRIFSDKPCQYVTTMGDGEVADYDATATRSIEVKKTPVVVDDEAANRIRYRMTPAQARQKYCAKYNQDERNKLIAVKQVVLGMYLADVIKVWGAPLSSDGNKVVFQEGDDEVTISLIEGCVINIERNLWDEPYIDEQPIENN